MNCFKSIRSIRFLQPSIGVRYDYYVQLVAIKRGRMRVANLKFWSARQRGGVKLVVHIAVGRITVLRQKSGSLGRCARVYATATTNPLPSTHHPTTMRRSFGQEISGNRRPKAELTPAARAALLAKHEAGVSRAELAHEFNVHPSCVYKTIKRWSNHKTLKSLLRSGRPEKLTRREKRAAI